MPRTSKQTPLNSLLPHAHADTAKSLGWWGGAYLTKAKWLGFEINTREYSKKNNTIASFPESLTLGRFPRRRANDTKLGLASRTRGNPSEDRVAAALLSSREA